MGGRGAGWGGLWQKLKQRSKITQIVEFSVRSYEDCMHPQRANVPLQDLDRRALYQWEPYQIPTAKLEAFFGAISPVEN